jgi:hypothetical protein
MHWAFSASESIIVPSFQVVKEDWGIRVIFNYGQKKFDKLPYLCHFNIMLIAGMLNPTFCIING